MLHPACAEPLTDEWWRGLGGHWPSAKDGRSQLLHDTRLNPLDLTFVPFFFAASAAKIMPVAGVPLRVWRRCEAPHPSRFGLCQPGGVVQEFTADWKREGASNEKLRRLQQIAGCRVQIAKSFKAQGPLLP
jgi:hypothetical protein